MRRFAILRAVLVLLDIGSNSALIITSFISAVGTFATALVAALVYNGNAVARDARDTAVETHTVAVKTQETVNGKNDELLARVALLEDLLRWQRGDEALPETVEEGGDDAGRA